jgi:hypothetical protein
VGYSNHNQTVFIFHINAYFGCILMIKFISWLYFGDKILMRHVLKLCFEMTVLPRKSHHCFDIAVIGMYTRIQ